ncbi:UNVERIFIED_CONTAM: hypothetical protein Slati_0227000 [Sesamum latifolium]|uniref:RNase H type-1 domain-containing protein n=1 Tax=Sesamum latifolium TaxID=2727402 RepID=A0AAW2YCK2_9LAMI
MEFAIRFEFKASINEAEYEALVISMRMAHEVGARCLMAYSDYQLIVKQVEGTYEAKEESIVQYLQQIAELKGGSWKTIELSVLLYNPTKAPGSLERPQAISPRENWRTPVVRWLEGGQLPENRWDAARLKARVTCFLLHGWILYKKSFTHPLFRVTHFLLHGWIHVLKEIHSGCYGAHAGTWILANKTLLAGYF